MDQLHELLTTQHAYIDSQLQEARAHHDSHMECIVPHMQKVTSDTRLLRSDTVWANDRLVQLSLDVCPLMDQSGVVT